MRRGATVQAARPPAYWARGRGAGPQGRARRMTRLLAEIGNSAAEGVAAGLQDSMPDGHRKVREGRAERAGEGFTMQKEGGVREGGQRLMAGKDELGERGRGLAGERANFAEGIADQGAAARDPSLKHCSSSLVASYTE